MAVLTVSQVSDRKSGKPWRVPRGLFSIASSASLISSPVLFKVTLEVRFQGVRKTNTNWDGTGLYVLYVVLVLEEDAEECQYLH